MEAPLKYHVRPICTIILNMEFTSQYDISRIKSLCENVTSTYYKENEKSGCTDIKASNFDFQVIIFRKLKIHIISFQVCVCDCVAGSDVRLPPRGTSWISCKG